MSDNESPFIAAYKTLQNKKAMNNVPLLVLTDTVLNLKAMPTGAWFETVTISFLSLVILISQQMETLNVSLPFS